MGRTREKSRLRDIDINLYMNERPMAAHAVTFEEPPEIQTTTISDSRRYRN
jgi:hypothetical protein